MDLFEELEKMALNVAEEPAETDAPSEETIHRWQTLFGYSYSDAVDKIEIHRSDISRKRITDEHWAMVRTKLESQGYDREAYEHELSRGRQPVIASKNQTKAVGNGRYLVKVEGPVTPELIQELSGPDKVVDVMRGIGDDGVAQFCILNATIKDALISKLANTAFKPTIVRLAEPAAKNLSSTSRYPTLSLDTTLPQHRPSTLDDEFLPKQDEYPVWYFFYGTLADPEVLMRHLGLRGEPMLWPASVRGGVLRTWAGKYRALVDGCEEDVVEGKAYEVETREHEDALRSYETSKYEVVRCVIQVGYREIPGCTFRFVGVADN
ncbi:uncharacterized protein PAC_16806 [Phialocephala subalpina]|uniref:Putative gamma-glutamylcyclotransferase n=1 Tax=Phialocephala subalpina TaxID=576137 RepID=A0A1L7XPD1_9HELO|nr:uncharacterized protein PAC_16806 [Phialocephala subalpina]